jgi:hypothetical protein
MNCVRSSLSNRSLRVNLRRSGYCFFGLLFWIMACQNLAAQLEDRYLQIGQTTRYWETYTHGNEEALGTLPGQATWPMASTTREDGRVAALFPVGFSSGGPDHRLLMVFEFNVSAGAPYEIVEGPYTINAIEPINDGDPHIDVQGAITEYSYNRYAMLGYWQEYIPEKDDEEARLEHHYYFLVVPKDGGEVQILCELAPIDSHIFSPGEMVYLPFDGTDDECFIVTNSKSGPEKGYWVFNTNGTLRRKITAAELYLADGIGQCNHNGPLEALPNGDLVAIASDYEMGDCPGWPYVVAVTFDRYGNYKGAWSFGGSLYSSPWYPVGFNAMCILPSGHYYVGSFFAQYYWDAAHASPDYGDRNYHTYRHFLVEPPTGFGSPLLQASPGAVDYETQTINTPVTESILLKNVGGAELVISEIVMEGDSVFQWKGPDSLSLAPSYGLSGAPGSSTSCNIELTALSPGKVDATLRIESNDPTNSTTLIEIDAFGVPPAYHLDPFLNLDQIVDPPHPVTFAQLSSDGTSLLVSVYVNDGGSRHTRLLRVPVVRSGNIITGLDTAGKTTVIDLGSAFGFDLVEGPAGTIWLGPSSGSSGNFTQILPDGTVLETDLPIPGNVAPEAFCFLSGTDFMYVVQRSESQVHLLQLVPRSGGGFDLEYVEEVGPSGPRSITNLLFWVENEMVYTIAEMSGDLWMTVNPADAQVDNVLPTLVAFDLDLRDLTYDPASGDLLLLYTDGQWTRFSGFKEMYDSPEAISLSFSMDPFRIRVAGKEGLTVRVEGTNDPNAAAWTSVGQITIGVGTNDIVDPLFNSQSSRWYRAIIVDN